MIRDKKKKQFWVNSFDDRVEIRTNHPLKNRLIMAWGLIRHGSFAVLAPTDLNYLGLEKENV